MYFIIAFVNIFANLNEALFKIFIVRNGSLVETVVSDIKTGSAIIVCSQIIG